jgi:hypothetical protein
LQPKELKRSGRHLATLEETKLDKIPVHNESLKRKSLWSGSLETEEMEDINAMETISLERINLEDTGNNNKYTIYLFQDLCLDGYKLHRPILR